ncbi:hypothetical protein NLG97_g391 [Lecanicillium saksenae]|uniref:Uncharacterized protein n=1 Tax=Lecanicillium saksenae TaxID=468837 RepID=A0ACC1R8K0_9HYPO|nr:hypothetical protein NLG97_g391 [Lecanicillium saksenae]
MRADIILLSSLVAGIAAIPVADNHVVHEKRSVALSSRYTKRAIEGETKVPVRIALKQQNLEKGAELLYKVSDPASPDYGNHYTAEQVLELFAPAGESVNAVKQWLIKSGIPGDSITIPRSKGWLEFETTASQLESVLKTKYHVYKRDNVADVETIGAEEYSLPPKVSEHVDFIYPGVAHISRQFTQEDGRVPPGRFPLRRRPIDPATVQKIESDRDATASCDKLIIPACIQALYSIPHGHLSDPSNKLGIFAFQSPGYSTSDLDNYWRKYASNIPQGTYPEHNLINGAKATTSPSRADAEAELDFQTSYPIIYPQGGVFFSTNGRDGLFNQFLDAIDGSYTHSSAYGETGDNPKVDGDDGSKVDSGKFKPTNIISFSYGWGELEAGGFPVNYQKRQCDEFLKLGLQGVSLLVSSGDDGVAWRGGECLGKKKNIFVPDYPGGCPYITVVGATTIPDGASIHDPQPEVASTSFSSGGGFSNIYPTADYQKAALSHYFSIHDPGYRSYNTSGGKIPDDGGIYNRAGRGYPDISAIGDNTAFFLNGEDTATGGTSESSPLVAAIFTRVNEERIAKGKKPLGFLNPAIYSHPEVFNDITVGSQPLGGPYGDDQPSECGNKGFSAVSGWDPVTGVGTPNYPRLLKTFVDL